VSTALFLVSFFGLWKLGKLVYRWYQSDEDETWNCGRDDTVIGSWDANAVAAINERSLWTGSGGPATQLTNLFRGTLTPNDRDGEDCATIKLRTIGWELGGGNSLGADYKAGYAAARGDPTCQSRTVEWELTEDEEDYDVILGELLADSVSRNEVQKQIRRLERGIRDVAREDAQNVSRAGYGNGGMQATPPKARVKRTRGRVTDSQAMQCGNATGSLSSGERFPFPDAREVPNGGAMGSLSHSGPAPDSQVTRSPEDGSIVVDTTAGDTQAHDRFPALKTRKDPGDMHPREIPVAQVRKCPNLHAVQSLSSSGRGPNPQAMKFSHGHATGILSSSGRVPDPQEMKFPNENATSNENATGNLSSCHRDPDSQTRHYPTGSLMVNLSHNIDSACEAMRALTLIGQTLEQVRLDTLDEAMVVEGELGFLDSDARYVV